MSGEGNTEGERGDKPESQLMRKNASKWEGLRVAEAQQIDKHFFFKDCQAVTH